MDESYQELLRRYRSGDDAAGEKLCRGLGPALYRTASRKLYGNHELAEEITQQALFILIEHTQKFIQVNDIQLIEWMCGVVRNLCRNYWRKRKQDCFQALSEEFVDDAPGPDHNLLAAELLDPFKVCRKYISEEDLNILKMKYIDHLTYKQIGERLGITAATATMRSQRAREALRKQLDPDGFGLVCPD